LTSRRIAPEVVCSGCNNTFGGGIDKVLTGQFEIIRNLLQMKSGSGRIAPMLTKVKAGSQIFNVRGDGHLELLAKPFTITKRADGRFDLQLMSRSLEEIDRRIPNIAAALGMPEEHVREQLVNGKAMMIEQRPATVLFNMIFGGPEAFRSAAKSCLVLWALKVGNDEVRGEPYRAVRDFILGHDDGFIRHRTQLDTRPLEQVDAVKQAYGPLFNLIYVRSDYAGQVIGHFTVYNMVASQIVLAEHGGTPNQVTGLVSDPLSPGDWSGAAARLFDVPFDWLSQPKYDIGMARSRFTGVMNTSFSTFGPKQVGKLSRLPAINRALTTPF
jgi:hypothetical protein